MSKESKPSKKTKEKLEHERAVKTVAKGAGIAFVGLFLGKLFAYLTRIFIARNLGPEAYGLISMGIAIISILGTIALLGFGEGLTRFIAFYCGKKKLGKVKSGITSAFKMSIPISILFGSLIFIFSEQISIFFSEPHLVLILQILSFSLPFYVIMSVSKSISLGFKMVKESIYTVDIGKNFSTFLLVVTLFFLGFEVFGSAMGFTLGFFVSSLIGVFYLIKKITPKLKDKNKIPSGKELFNFSLPLLFTLTLLLIMQWTDVLMLGYFDAAVNVGIYSAALNTCILLNFIKNAFGFIIPPTISELYSRKKIKEIGKIYKISTRWIFSIVFPIFLLFILFPDNILIIFFGKEFVSGSVPFMILSLGYLIVAIFGITYYIITAMGRTKINFYLTSMAAASNLILNLILIPAYGMLGASVAMTFSLFMRFLLSLVFVYSKTGKQPIDMNYLRPLFSSILSVFILYFLIKNIFGTKNIFVLIGSFILYLLLYGFLLVFTKSIKKEDMLIIRSIENKHGLNMRRLKKLLKRMYSF